jgi:hypothetical protein
MATLIDDLAKRKAEIEAANRAGWGAFVAKIASTTPDPDDVLKQLDTMGRSLEELQTALELLERRKRWAEQLAAGDRAEAEYPQLMKQLEDGAAELKKMTEAHELKMLPIENAVMRARERISEGSTAKSELLRSVSRETSDAVTADIEAKKAVLIAERDELRKRMNDRETWISTVRQHGSNANPLDLNRFDAAVAEFEEWRKADAAFGTKFEALQAELAKACEVLLLPETL